MSHATGGPVFRNLNNSDSKPADRSSVLLVGDQLEELKQKFVKVNI